MTLVCTNAYLGTHVSLHYLLVCAVMRAVDHIILTLTWAHALSVEGLEM